MMKIPPKFLYKYMGKRLDRIGDILLNKRLFFSDPINLNDPFDCACGLDYRNATDEDWIRYFTHLAEIEEPNKNAKYWHEKAVANFKRGRHKNPDFTDNRNMIEIVKKKGRNMGVLCLSSNPKSVMMWAHYADNHRGLLLKFDSKYMGDRNSNELRCFNVCYNKSFPTISDYIDALGCIKNEGPQIFSKLFFCRKSKEWIYEKEWRFFAGKPNSYVEFDEPMLSGLIFGWKMPENRRNLIRAWLENYVSKPKLYEAEPCLDRFQMRIIPIKM